MSGPGRVVSRHSRRCAAAAIARKFPLAKPFAARYADAAEKALGPFTADDKSDTQPGCR